MFFFSVVNDRPKCSSKVAQFYSKKKHMHLVPGHVQMLGLEHVPFIYSISNKKIKFIHILERRTEQTKNMSYLNKC